MGFEDKEEEREGENVRYTGGSAVVYVRRNTVEDLHRKESPAHERKRKRSNGRDSVDRSDSLQSERGLID